MPEYRTFFGLDPRLTVWAIAQLHLLFGAFVLGVPIFAWVVELLGHRSADHALGERYDKLAYEFTKLLSAAFSTTAALGGLFTFVLFSCYPAFMAHLTDVFHGSFFVYALLFFGEGFTLYTYYYGWHRFHGREGRIDLRLGGGLLLALFLFLFVCRFASPQAYAWMGSIGLSSAILTLGVLASAGIMTLGWGGKAFHLYLGLCLNLFGLAILLIANSWASYMMSPPGLEPAAGAPLASHWEGTRYIGSSWEAFANFLWMPLNIHRFIANISFGGAICGAYAAVKFLGSRTDADRAHYDWMGYIGNMIAIAGLLPLPFAGYYLGREIYSFNPTMGQDMMGGTFSWSFIIQGFLVGGLFIIGNYYLWSGMRRIPGGERYDKFIAPMMVILFVCFAIWLIPHNLALGGLEKKFGLMPGKNAAVQLMLLVTFVGFMLYRRANKKSSVPFRQNAGLGFVVVSLATLAACLIVGIYARSGDLSDANPDIGRFMADALRLGPFSIALPKGVTWAATLRGTSYLYMAALVLAALLFFANRCQLGQTLVVGATAVLATLWLGQHGFTIMEKANPLVRQTAVVQVLMVLGCYISATAMDLLMFRGAESLGEVRWGRMHARSQLALAGLCTLFVLTMGLMGYVRSGMRKGWHVVSVLKDKSPWAQTPNEFTMTVEVALITLIFLAVVSFVFWTASLGEKKQPEGGPGAGRGFMQVAGFVVMLLLLFVGLGWKVTDTRGGWDAGAPVDVKEPTVAWGEAVFYGTGPVAGNCQTCHAVGSRGSVKTGPNLGPGLWDRITARAQERKLTGPVEFMVESIVQPSAYVPEPYGPIMPAVMKPPTSLEAIDVKSIIMYLASIEGHQVDPAAIKLPGEGK